MKFFSIYFTNNWDKQNLALYQGLYYIDAACKESSVQISPGLVDFSIGLVNSVFNLTDGQVMFLRNSNNRRTVKSILLVKKLSGLVEMTSGLVDASFSLPKWQAVNMIFFVPCRVSFIIAIIHHYCYHSFYLTVNE